VMFSGFMMNTVRSKEHVTTHSTVTPHLEIIILGLGTVGLLSLISGIVDF